MKTTILKILACLVAAFGLIGLSTPAFADEPAICSADGVSAEVKAAAGCPNAGASVASFDDTLIGILNAIVGLLAIVAIIVIVIGGVTYMTSAGDAGKIQKAKATILYAVIGLIICGIAAIVVNWAVATIVKANQPSGAGTSYLKNTIAFISNSL